MKTKIQYKFLVAVLFVTIFHSLSAQNQESGESDSSLEYGIPDSLRVSDSIRVILPDRPVVEPIETFVQYVDPANPDIPDVGSSYAVGTSSGIFSVSETGAAEYSLTVSCPDGGNLTPRIGIAYNSQNAAVGLAGYGFSITGISAITRGGKTLFDNGGIVSGVSYTVNDNLYLDGKRLILLSGSSCQATATYCLEGDPYTIITAYGTYHDNAATTWFEVKTADGKTYRYGSTADSRISYSNNKGNPRIASWYVNRMEDVYGNYIDYTYTVRNLCAYPNVVTYGKNKNKDRGLTNRIVFEYTSLANPTVFNIEDRKGSIDQCLSAITTSLNGTTYRKYCFTYDNTSDQTLCKYPRLTKIQEENGNGESLAPVEFKWNFLTSGIYSTSLNIPTTEGSSFVEELDRNFFAADLNGDGISDIVRVSPVKVIDYTDSSTETAHYETRIYISRSEISSSGSISYRTPIVFKLPSDIVWDDFNCTLGGAALMDIDGDGYNDIILPYHDQVSGMWNSEIFYTILGCYVAGETTRHVEGYGISLKATDENPLCVTADFDKDGKDEVLCVEQAKKNGLYSAYIVKMKEDKTFYHEVFSLTFPENPEKLFCGDYNNDGLTDIIILYNGGYKIYYNNGGSADALKFSESKTKTGTNLANQWRVQQGDFDGDGLLDFVYFVSGETWLWIARNNGDGTFTCTKTDDIGVGNHSSSKDDNRFAVTVYDIDRDGRSDVMICKAGYVHHGFPTFKNEYTDTQIRWMISDGTTLKLDKSKVKHRENDANERFIFLGDFTGDGNMELANYGSDLNSSSDTFAENKIYVYKATGFQTGNGRITRITDGMGNTTAVEYAYATSPEVYTKTESENQYPVNTYTLPLSVVGSVTSTNGVAGSQTIRYSYKDLKIHMGGRGPLGFMEMTSTDKATGKRSVKSIEAWDTDRWIPTKVKTVTAIGEKTTTSTATYSVEDVGGTYFVYESESTLTDMDGNTAVTASSYDIEKGVILAQVVRNDGDEMYKEVEYSGYQKKGGRWLPTVMRMTQKHSDDPDPYVSETHYSYDDRGNVISNIVNYGTPLALTTTATYDVYGNCLSSVSSGKDVRSVTLINEYDSSGRFVVKSYSDPAAAVTAYTYDSWGNVLTEKDITDPSNILTTTNTYDDWSRLISTVGPDGSKTVSSVGWGSDNDKKYYVLTETSDKPWVLTWYDNAGHEVLQKTFGPQSVLISRETEYDSRGRISTVKNVNGKFYSTESFTYDDYGRLLSHIVSNRATTAFSYGNRSVTTTVDGKVSTKVSDAWGNILSSSDPSGNTVEYVYGSNGKPVEITTGGSTIEISYDEAGNRISLTDPDAGTVTGEYSADGKLIRQTDARGVETRNSFDNLGRISKVQIGSNTIVNTYGTSGNGNLRLVKQTMGENSIEFTHDRFGRITTEKRNVEGNGSYSFEYRYDSKNRLEKTTYPGGLDVVYLYDDYGFKTGTTADGKEIYRLEKYEGLSAGTSVFMDSITTTVTCNYYGYETGRKIARGDNIIENLTLEFERKTGNLLSRKRNKGLKEYFEYDNLDRLTTVKRDVELPVLWPVTLDLEISKKPVVEEIMSVEYSPDGNILSKTGIGDYTYNSAFRPHAVVSVENEKDIIPTETLLTSFNDFNKIDHIEDESSGYSMDFSYGPDMQRWYTGLTKDGNPVRSTVYAGAYEKITDNGTVREFYYLDGGTILIRENGVFKPYIAFTDHLGSILSVMDADGEKVFDASYDAWGLQTVALNSIGLQRGYTGHEMLPEFGIINMNGRLYDPALGRFFSPDNYVQLPGFSQSYNRYSYCLNNPLKYTDPSGEFIEFIAFGLFNVASSMMQAAANGDNIWKAGLMGALSSGAAFGIGQAFLSTGFIGKAIQGWSPLGRELLRAGAHGLSGGLLSMLGGGNFGSGLASGAMSSGLGAYAKGLGMNMGLRVLSSAAMGGIAAWATGGNFLQGALQGMKIGLFNDVFHDLYYDENGELRGTCKEVVCIGEKPSFFDKANDAIESAALVNSYIDRWGYALEKKAANSTFGSNYKFYFRDNSKLPFYGNQYVGTIGLKAIGETLTKYTKPIGNAAGVMQMGLGFVEDVTLYSQGERTYGYNTMRASANFAASMAAAKYGAQLGFIIGSCAGPAGSIILGAALGFVGAYYGGEFAANIIDKIYGK